jgi:hypothetical protein
VDRCAGFTEVSEWAAPRASFFGTSGMIRSYLPCIWLSVPVHPPLWTSLLRWCAGRGMPRGRSCCCSQWATARDYSRRAIAVAEPLSRVTWSGCVGVCAGLPVRVRRNEQGKCVREGLPAWMLERLLGPGSATRFAIGVTGDSVVISERCQCTMKTAVVPAAGIRQWREAMQGSLMGGFRGCHLLAVFGCVRCEQDERNVPPPPLPCGLAAGYGIPYGSAYLGATRRED